ncbi:MAG: hypothetical protein KDC87_21230 [Planctomycetes bacterium]|nr:hypothetical protein [Planctomycetota bacterium]MCB9889320.1 hypothetical protein [Planctomycetota bacterium]
MLPVALSAVFGPALLSAQDGTQSSPPEARSVEDPDRVLQRMRQIGLGDYLLKQQGLPAIGAADANLCYRAMVGQHEELRRRATQVLGELARRRLVDGLGRARIDRVFRILLEQAGGADPELSSWSVRALVMLRRDSDPRTRVLTPEQGRQVLSKALAMAVAKVDLQQQRHAGRLLQAFTADGGPKAPNEAARVLLAGLARVEGHREKASAQAALADVSLRAALASLRVDDPALASEVFELLLVDARRLPANHFQLYSAANCLQGIARIVGVLPAAPRRRALAFLLEKARDPKLRYMPTSGVRAPFQHYGLEALAHAVPVLTGDERTAAVAVVERVRDGLRAQVGAARIRGMEFTADDLTSMFRDIDAALAAPRTGTNK